MRLCLIALLTVSAACAGAPTEPQASVDTTLDPRALELVDMDGAPADVRASLAAGRAVALVFWQSWCGSCLQEAPALARAAREQAGRIDFVGVVPGPDSSVDEAAVRARVAELGLPYPQVRDRDLALTRAFRVEGTPTIILLEGEAPRVTWRGHRPPASWDAFGLR